MPRSEGTGRLTIPASIDYLERVQRFIIDECARLEAGEAVCAKASLIAEELFVNIASYAYPAEGPALVTIYCDRDDTRRLRLVFEDQGEPFDPASTRTPDIDAGLFERQIGGLGILMVRRMSDEIRYERRSGMNILDVRVASGE